MLDKTHDTRLQVTVTLLDQIVALGLRTLQKFPTGAHGFERFIFLSMLERFTFHLESVTILLRTFRTNGRVESAMGLTLRACLLDFMTVTYLSSYMTDIKSDTDTAGIAVVDFQVQQLITEQVRYTLDYLKMGKDCGLIKKMDYADGVRATWANYPDLFSPGVTGDMVRPADHLICKDIISPKKMFMRIHHHVMTKKWSPVFDIYMYYSKYEHFGVMSHLLSRIDPNEKLDMAIAAMQYTIKGFGAALTWLNMPPALLDPEVREHTALSEQFDKI